MVQGNVLANFPGSRWRFGAGAIIQGLLTFLFQSMGVWFFVESSVLRVKCSSARTSSCPEVHKCVADLLLRYFSQGLGYSAVTAGVCAFSAITYIDIHMVKLYLINHQLP